MKLKKVLFLTIPFILVIIILVYTPKSKNAESSVYNIKKENYNMNNYLEKNHSEIDVNSCTGFNLLDEDIKKNDVILAGEYSGVSKNYLVKLSLFKYLNEKHGVRYLLEDIGYSQAYFINEYLKSGDESILKSLYLNAVGYGYRTGGTEFDYKESYDFWKKLRKYNLSLSDDKRIFVIGIGFESQEWTILKYINLLLPEREPPEEIKSFIKAFRDKCKEKNELEKNMDKILKSSKKPEEIDKEIIKSSQKIEEKDKEIGKSIQKIQKNLETNPGLYEKYLGAGYFDFNFIVNNVFIDSSGGIYSFGPELDMYSKFKKIYFNLPMGKYFGQFNMEQVYQNIPLNVANQNEFASFLNGSGSPVAGRVLSIAYAYENSKAISSLADDAKAAESFDVDILKNISKSDTTLFKLNGDKSPFAAKAYLVIAKDDMHTTDYFKYILLIKNSKAVNYVWKMINVEGD
ncbi:MAG: hypothetical protein LIR50_21975 [Bacillota bacterium]|nr:hypothetical protein [Bacillota bacterium]